MTEPIRPGRRRRGALLDTVTLALLAGVMIGMCAGITLALVTIHA